MLVICNHCGKEFEKSISEFNRSEKLGRKHYCSLSCSGHHAPIIKNPEKFKKPSTSHLNPKNRIDEYSPFRNHFKRLKNRKHEIDVDLDYLKKLWEDQEGTCPITGWKLTLPKSTSHRGKCDPNAASLDRIDNNKGYIKGNIRWISVMANFARHEWGDKELIDFCNAVYKHNKS
jgi:hypothetical protein